MGSHNLPTTREISYHLPKRKWQFLPDDRSTAEELVYTIIFPALQRFIACLGLFTRTHWQRHPGSVHLRAISKYPYSIILIYKPTFKLEQFWQLVQFTILEQSWQLLQFSMLEQFWQSVQLVIFEHCWEFSQLLQLLQNEQSTQSLQLEHWSYS